MKSRFISFFLSPIVLKIPLSMVYKKGSILLIIGLFSSLGYQLNAQTAPVFTKNLIDGSINDVWDAYPADLDKDGDQDVLTVSRSGAGSFIDELAWYKSDGASTPSFTKISIDDTTNNSRNIFVVDIDEDDDLDIILVTQIDGFNDGSNIFWYENDGGSDPAFTRQTLGLVKGFASDLDVADLDDDGDLDVAVTDNSNRSPGFSTESVTWFENDGATDPSFTKNEIENDFRFAQAIRIGDIDGDGDLDVVVGNDDLDDIVWFENDGAANPTFSLEYADRNALGVEQIELADIDNDGDLDIVWTDEFSDYIAWLENNGAADPSFTEVRIEDYNASALVAVADMDLDGDLDVVSGSSLEDDIYWYESDGATNPTFTRHEIDSLLDQPEKIRIADIDGDGSPDIVGAAFRADDIMWYENDLVSVNPNSISLDGTNDYVSIPAAVISALGDNATMTLEAWVKPDYENQTEPLGALLAINTASYGNVLLLTIDNGASANAGEIRVLDNTGDVLSFEIASSKVENNSWVHVAYSLSGTTGTLYVNGNLVGTHTQDTPLSSDNIWSVGQDFDPGPSEGNYLNAQIDEIRIWNTARTQNQIQSNIFQSLNGDETGLISYWPLDETNTVLAYDKSSSGNNATLENGASRSSDNNPYGTFVTGDEGWRMMTSPVGNTSYGVLLDTLWTQGFTGADATNGTSNVYTWSESSQNFSSITNATEVPTDGAGFLVYVYDDVDFDGTGDGFPKVIQTDSSQRTGFVSPSLSYTDTGTLANDGWNIVGNPYGSTIDWDVSSGFSTTNLDDSFYIWSDSANSGAGDYLSWNGSTGTFGGGEIAPWQGFWVKANEASPALSLTNEARSAGGILRKQAPVPQVKFTLKGERLSSKTILMFDDLATSEKDALDAYKLQSLNNDFLSLFTQLPAPLGEDGAALDINALPLNFDGDISIPLDFDGSSLSGYFELNWNPTNLPDGITMTLVDSETNTEIDLTEASSYSFELETAPKTKAVKTQELASPQHNVFSPNVMKAKANGSRFIIEINAATSVSTQQSTELPTSVELAQNYPNPFNPATTIQFALPSAGDVRLEVFNLLGQNVATLANEHRAAGTHTIRFDASRLASGIYIYRLHVRRSLGAGGRAGKTITKKLTLIK